MVCTGASYLRTGCSSITQIGSAQMLFCRQMSESPGDGGGWYQICRGRGKNRGNRRFSALVCARLCASVCARDWIGGQAMWRDPTGPNGGGRGGAGDPSSGLNDNPRYSIPLKRSFALVCMYYDHLQLSLPPPSPPRYVVRSDRIDTSSSRSWSWNETFVYGIRKS